MNQSNKELLELKLLKLQELERKKQREKLLPHLYGQKMFWWQRQFWESTNRYTFLTCANQCGKDLWAETWIPTPNGFKRMKEIAIGDKVFDRFGNTCNVTAIPWNQDNETYKVHFNDGTSVICGINHEWIAKSPVQRFKKELAGYDKWSNYELREIIERSGMNPKPGQRYAIPVTESVEYSEQYLFDPYLIGLLIGDGGLTAQTNLTTADEEIAEYVTTKYFAKQSGKYGYRIHNIHHIIKNYGLDCNSWDKAIPNEYLQGSFAQRLALLQGLMDSDGSCDKRFIATYSTTSPKLRDTFIQLVNSLGGLAWYRTKQGKYKKNGVTKICRDSYDIVIDIKHTPFRLKRKLARWRFNTRYKHERVIVKIEPWKRLRTKCISVDSPDNSYLCTKNYIVTHNSSIAIKKAIRLATDKNLQRAWWPKPDEFPMPTYSFYFYPSLKLATREVENKWVTEFLPRGELIEDAEYGWELEYRDKEIHSIHYKNGHTTYFMSYTQKVSDLQASSPAFVCADEEMPMHLWGEISARLVASKGPFSLVCTPTIGEMHWQRVFEQNLYPNARVIRATMYDCLQFEDGSPGTKTVEEIEDFKAKLPTKRDVDIRVYGKFAKADGLVYPTFDAQAFVAPETPTPEGWQYYSGIDIGGGGSGHPGAFCVVAVRPDLRFAKIVRSWHGGLTKELTSNRDIIDIYMRITEGIKFSAQYFDWNAKDFGMQARQIGLEIMPAEKSHEIGEGLLNTLFKNKMLVMEDNEYNKPYIDIFIQEFSNLKKSIKKKDAMDESCDVVRYALSKVPFDTGHVDRNTEQTQERKPKERRGSTRDPYEFFHDQAMQDDVDYEIAFWNDQYGE